MEEKTLLTILQSIHEVNQELNRKIMQLQAEHVKLVNRVRELELNNPTFNYGGY